jgi:hypothetical protein
MRFILTQLLSRALSGLLLRLKPIGTVAAPFLAALSATKKEIARECTILIEIRRGCDHLVPAVDLSSRVLFHGGGQLHLASTDAVSELEKVGE